MSSTLTLASGFLILTTSTIAISIRVHLDRFEQQNGFDMANTTGFRVRKYNRTTSVLSGELYFFYDLGDEYIFTLTLAYSRLGNNQFNQYPMKVSKAKMCDALNGPYKDYQYLIKDNTNFPQVGNERVCPFPRGRYWVKDWTPESSFVPPVVPAGYWRFSFDVLDSQGNLAMRNTLYVHIIKEIV